LWNAQAWARAVVALEITLSGSGRPSPPADSTGNTVSTGVVHQDVHPAYAGVGSRETPVSVLPACTEVARVLAARGYVLRSGGARGADQAFAAGTSRLELFRPGYDRSGRGTVVGDPAVLYRAELLAATIVRHWDRCDEWARELHVRNVFQVWGADLEIADTVLGVLGSRGLAWRRYGWYGDCVRPGGERPHSGLQLSSMRAPTDISGARLGRRLAPGAVFPGMEATLGQRQGSLW
jgi:hypothetical protein